MASPRANPPPEDVPSSAQREVPGPLVAAIEDSASFLAAIWNREKVDLPTSAAQLHVLLIIERHRDINLSGLATQLGALVSSASRLCDRLEAAGFLHRVHGASRRAVILRLSPEGRDLLDRLRRQRREDLARVLARMPPAARTALASGLAQFRAAAGKNPLPLPGQPGEELFGPA
ncbi:MAG TPA: MarR family transcriptional regulator [Streptosporangiaceae bacterium]|jgi:DNA-binding MarR family transcriptional regulator|nr:MarR family transcriptional regulator [Streptosporangiaceae bacterium]